MCCFHCIQALIGMLIAQFAVQCSNIGELLDVPGGYMEFPQHLWRQLAQNKLVYWTNSDKEIPMTLPKRQDWKESKNRRKVIHY